MASKFQSLLYICMLCMAIHFPPPAVLACGKCPSYPPYHRPSPPKSRPPKIPGPHLPPPTNLPPVRPPPGGVLPPIINPPVIPPPHGGVLPPKIPSPHLPPPINLPPIRPPPGRDLPPIINPPVISPPPGGVLPPIISPPPGGILPPIINPPGGGGITKCPIDTLKLGLCVDVLRGLVHVGIGNPVENACCPVLQGLLELEAAICLCTTIRLKLLNLNIFLPIALQVLATCGLTPPPGFVCPPL